MHRSGKGKKKKETSIKQIEFKSLGKAGSQRVSTGNGRFMLHLYNRVASRCSLLTRLRGGSEGPRSPPRTAALSACPPVLLARRNEPQTQHSPSSLQLQTPKSPGPTHPHFGSSPAQGALCPLAAAPAHPSAAGRAMQTLGNRQRAGGRRGCPPAAAAPPGASSGLRPPPRSPRSPPGHPSHPRTARQLQLVMIHGGQWTRRRIHHARFHLP